MEGYNLGAIYASVKLDTSGLVTGVSAVKRELASMASDVQQRAGELKSLGTTMSLGITAPLIAAGAAADKMAMDAVESENLFEVSMGKMAESARAWSKDLQQQLGLNQYEVRQTVGTFNVMLNSFGMGEKASYDMAKGLTQLAYDMASFYNLDPKDAFEKLQSGISGEIEPLRRLGIVVSETMVKQYAYSNGIAAQGKELTEQQKILARYGLIMQSTSKAQGDLARTIDSPVNQLRVLKSQVSEIAVEFGQIMIPATQDAVGILKDVATTLSGLDPASKTALVGIGVFVAGIGPAIVGIASLANGITTISTVVLPLFASALSGPVILAVVAAVAAIAGLVKLVQYLNRDTTAEAKAAANSAKAKADQAAQSKVLVSEYQRLEEKTNRTTEESKRMHEILQKLWEINPDLISGYDAQRGALGLVANAYDVASKSAKKYAAAAIDASYAERKSEIKQLRDQINDLQNRKNTLEMNISQSAARAMGTTMPEGLVNRIPGEQQPTGAASLVFAPSSSDAEKQRNAKMAELNRKQMNVIEFELQQANKQLSEDEAWVKAIESGKNPYGGFGVKSGSTTKSLAKSGPSSSSKGLSTSERAVIAQENAVESLQQTYDKAGQHYENFLAVGDTKKAETSLKQMNDITIQLEAAYKSLAAAKESVTKKDEKTGKVTGPTAEERKQIELQAQSSISQVDDRYASDRKKLDEKVAASTKESAAKRLEIEEANQNAMLALAKARGEKELALQMEYTQRYNDLSKQGVNPVTAQMIAMEEYRNKVQELHKEEAEEQTRIKEQAYQKEVQILDYEYQHQLKNTEQYIAALRTKQNEYDKYSAQWLEIQNKIEDANTTEAEQIATQAKALAATHKEQALKILNIELQTYEAMGDAGVEACKRIRDAISELSAQQEKNKQETISWSRAWAQEVMNLGDNFANALADMITGTGSFRDFMQQTFREVLAFVIDFYIKSMMQSMLANKVMQDEAAKTAAANAAAAASAGSGGNTISLIAGAVSTVAGIIPFFDNPINDTGAVRSGADLARLTMQGINSELGHAFPTGRNIETKPISRVVTNHINTPVTVQIDKVSGIEDIERAADTMAWMITRKIKLIPTGA